MLGLDISSGGGGLSLSNASSAKTGDAVFGSFNFSPSKNNTGLIVVGVVSVFALILLMRGK